MRAPYPPHYIPCTVGILTYNSGAYLARALESVRACAELLIADGGSTDDTLAIAKRYGARVVPQSGTGGITDFSLERNRMVNMATYDWFLYIDSDEVASPALIDAIRDVVARADPSAPRLYRIWQQYASGDMRTRYRSYKKQYQIRFFNRTTGARFTKRIHEHLRPPEGFPVGTLDASWATPLDAYLDWEVFKGKVRRNAQVIEEYGDKNIFVFMRQGILPGVVTTAKWCVKNVYVRVRYPWRECIPFRYELYKLYEVWYMIGAYIRRYVRLFL